MRIHLIPGILMVAALAACSGDSTGPGAGGGGERPRGINPSEANAISRALLGPGVGVARDGVDGRAPSASRQPGEPSLALDGGEIPFEFTVACQPSGSVHVSGGIGAFWDATVQLIVVNARLTLRHRSCPVQTDNGLLTVTGDPDVKLTATAAGNVTGIKALLVTQTGAVTWTRADGTSGRCEAQVAGLAIAGTPNYHVTGTVCGVPVDFTGPL